MFFNKHEIEVDFCVVGGGVAGICAAVAAARHGARTVLVQDRPMLGGNASSEIRMWICGAHGKNVKEAGILEEFQLENLRWNPTLNFGICDHVLIDFVRRQPNLTLLLNCTCDGVVMDGCRIAGVEAWQMSTQKRFFIKAHAFADCSGDCILRASGAQLRRGREASSEFGESFAPAVADDKTMGSSILIQTRETERHVPFQAPPWSHHFQEKGFHRVLTPTDNFWWLEYGGVRDTVADAEEIRDELLKMAYGYWELLKNSPSGIARGYDIDWIGVLPGKRESYRYVGDHILTQLDIEAEGRFDDMVAYGGWTMDDHNPLAFYTTEPPTIFHPAPSPYGIPLRCLYSRNVENLYFAGRNISCTHIAMSSTRVMGTCATLGQAVGTAAALGARYGLMPRQIAQSRIRELQQTLMDDDAWLPWHNRTVPQLSLQSSLTASCTGDTSVLRNGRERNDLDDTPQYFDMPLDSTLTYTLPQTSFVTEIRLVLDSRLGSESYKRMPCRTIRNGWNAALPPELLKGFSVETLSQGQWRVVFSTNDNFRRLVRLPVKECVDAVRFTPTETWGTERARVFEFEIS